MESQPGARVLLVRRPGRAGGRLRLALWSAADDRRLAWTEIGAVDEVATIDLASGRGLEVSEEPLVLVCGHGRRDPCCARLGPPVLRALDRALGGETVWLSSHQGGHRFGANVLLLPAGLQLGRVRPEHAPAVAEAVRTRRVPVELLRGRISLSPSAQAAERAVRAALGLSGLDEVVPLAAEEGLELYDTPRGRVAVLVREREGPLLPLSCGEPPQPTRVLEAEIARIEPRSW